MRNDFESNYLMHHGILGQKWGHKNGPPYPLGSSDHSASEKKAGWRESLTGKIQEHRRKKKQFKEDQEKYNNARLRMNTADYRRRWYQREAANQTLGRMERETNQSSADMFEEDYQREKALIDSLTKKYGEMQITNKEIVKRVKDGESKIRDEFRFANKSDYRYNPEAEIDKSKMIKGSTYELRNRSYDDLYHEILNKSGDWYESKGVSASFKKEVSRHKKELNKIDERNGGHNKKGTVPGSKDYEKARRERQIEYRKYIDNLAGIVLKDLGYEDTKENREYLKRSHVIDWD